ncbi:hypothetical protein ACP70R_000353 [Stipagrostis hirtigluma subsp. patula]
MADTSALAPASYGQLQSPQTVVNHDNIVEIGTSVRTEGLKQYNGGKEQSKIPRFPANLRGFGRSRDYIAPRTVAIGPYHHVKPELHAMEEVKRDLQAMEEVKRTAVDLFFQGSDERGACEEMMIPIARDARGYYADSNALAGITDDEFCTMMFVDGCFLVQFLYYMICTNEETSWLGTIIQQQYICIMRDIMLLENQIPWPVIEFFMRRRGLPMEKIISWLTLAFIDESCLEEIEVVKIEEGYKPSHLLCLLYLCNVGNKQVGELPRSANALSLSTGAAELAEMGMKLKQCKTRKVSDMNIEKGLFFGKLYLMPLSLDSSNACWLVNMAAFEMCTAASFKNENYLNAYLSIVAVLMDKEEDVGELNARRIVSSSMDNGQTFEFFKDLVQNLMPGQAYYRLIHALEDYQQKRRVWIAIYRFFYKNMKKIIAVLSVVGVLVGIVKGLLPLNSKQK